MKYWKKIRTAVLTVAILAPLGFGAVQATASTPAKAGASCSAFACRTECAPFGGDLVPGGPGEPLQCACCG